MGAKKQFIFGVHPVAALLNKRGMAIERLYIKEGRRSVKLDQLLSVAKKARISVEICSLAYLDHLANGMNHQGIIAHCLFEQVFSPDLETFLTQLTQPAFLLILDNIQDPHNLGACFRAADAAGVQAILAPKDRAASITPIVSKVASGAVENIPFIQVTNLARTLQQLQERGLWIYGATEQGECNLFETTLSGPLAIVMGNEGQGLRRLTQAHCDTLVHIPMQGSVSSLNIAVATGIILFEVVRQRQCKR